MCFGLSMLKNCWEVLVKCPNDRVLSSNIVCVLCKQFMQGLHWDLAWCQSTGTVAHIGRVRAWKKCVRVPYSSPSQSRQATCFGSSVSGCSFCFDIFPFNTTDYQPARSIKPITPNRDWFVYNWILITSH